MEGMDGRESGGNGKRFQVPRGWGLGSWLKGIVVKRMGRVGVDSGRWHLVDFRLGGLEKRYGRHDPATRGAQFAVGHNLIKPHHDRALPLHSGEKVPTARCWDHHWRSVGVDYVSNTCEGQAEGPARRGKIGRSVIRALGLLNGSVGWARWGLGQVLRFSTFGGFVFWWSFLQSPPSDGGGPLSFPYLSSSLCVPLARGHDD